MDGYVLGWRWLAQAAAGGLIVLALGSLAARLCRQPVLRRGSSCSRSWPRSPSRGWARCRWHRSGRLASYCRCIPLTRKSRTR